MDQRTALLVGASGLIASELLQYLVESPEYKSVTILVRHDYPLSHPKLITKIIDFDNWPFSDLEKVDDIYCCLGTTIKKAKTKEQFMKVDLEYPIKLARWGAESGVSQYLVVSALGANSGSRVFYNQVKGKLEDELKRIDIPQVHIFRPSLLIGDRKEFRLGEKIGEYVMKVFRFTLVGRMKKYRAIEAKQVAYAMYKKANGQNDQAYLIYESDMIEKIN